MNAIRAFAKGLSAACDHAAGWLLAILVVLNGVSVYMRYVAVDSISWSEEAIRYIAIWITFLGSGSAAGRGGSGSERKSRIIPTPFSSIGKPSYSSSVGSGSPASR